MSEEEQARYERGRGAEVVEHSLTRYLARRGGIIGGIPGGEAVSIAREAGDFRRWWSESRSNME